MNCASREEDEEMLQTELKSQIPYEVSLRIKEIDRLNATFSTKTILDVYSIFSLTHYFRLTLIDTIDMRHIDLWFIVLM